MIEDFVRIVAQIKRACQKPSLHFEEWTHLLKASFADAANDDQVFNAAKASVPRAVLNDARSQAYTDARQTFEFLLRCVIDVDLQNVQRGVLC